jgi:hypothetical protein
MSENQDRPDDLRWEAVREELHREFPLLRRSYERTEAVAAAIAKEMRRVDLDPRFARFLANEAANVIEEFEEGTGEEPDEFALHVTGYPRQSQAMAIDLVDQMMGLLTEYPRLLGVVGRTADGNSPGVTFTVKAPDILAALRVGVGEVGEVLVRLGVRPDVMKVEAEPAELFWGD